MNLRKLKGYGLLAELVGKEIVKKLILVGGAATAIYYILTRIEIIASNYWTVNALMIIWGIVIVSVLLYEGYVFEKFWRR